MALLCPVRCFTCNKTIDPLWRGYQEILKLIEEKEGQITAEDRATTMDALGVKRYCCRRMFLGHKKDLIDEVLLYQDPTLHRATAKEPDGKDLPRVYLAR